MNMFTHIHIIQENALCINDVSVFIPTHRRKCFAVNVQI